VLRIETVINNPEEYRLRKQVLRNGKQRAEWVAPRKGVAHLFRYRGGPMPATSMHWLRWMIRQRASRRCSA
jgi:hypothetical protein